MHPDNTMISRTPSPVHCCLQSHQSNMNLKSSFQSSSNDRGFPSSTTRRCPEEKLSLAPLADEQLAVGWISRLCSSAEALTLSGHKSLSLEIRCYVTATVRD